MTLLRWIAMHPQVQIVRGDDGIGRVARDENNVPVITGYAPKHTERLYDKPSIARRESNAYAGRHRGDGFGRVLVVDLHELPDVDATEHEKYELAERLMIKWTEEHRRLHRLLFGTELEAAPAPRRIACAGCGGVESVCNCPCGSHFCGCACHRLEAK